MRRPFAGAYIFAPKKREIVSTMPLTSSDQLSFDPLSQAFAADPYPTYAALRERAHPYYYEDVDTWMLTKMADVENVALDKTMLRGNDDVLTDAERKAQQRKMNWHDMPHHERFVQFNLLESEGDVHDRLRKLVFREFTPGMILKQRGAIQAFVDKLLAELVGKNEIDFVEDFASHIPGHIIGRMLGVPDEDCPQLRVWSENVVRFFNVGCDDNDKRIAEQATEDFYLYLLDLLKLRETAPHDDLLSRMLAQKKDGLMTDDELIATSMLILMAGHGSTIDVLGSGMHSLLKFPDQRIKLRDDPSLIKTAVQEMFRYEAPLPYFHRFATQDCTVGGQYFTAGTRFGLLYGAANRDPARFDAPDTFDVTRSQNRHVAFGGGTHFCLGNHLARLDMDVIFTTLNERFTDVQLVDARPEYKSGLSVRGPKSLQIAWKEV